MDLTRDDLLKIIAYMEAHGCTVREAMEMIADDSSASSAPETDLASEDDE